MSKKKKAKATKFYTFNQNNSGGVFVRNRNVDHFVIVEANDAEQANLLAESIGIYFDGCYIHRDCPCCGDRWYPTSENYDSAEAPTIYGEKLDAESFSAKRSDNRTVVIHFADGHIMYAARGADKYGAEKKMGVKKSPKKPAKKTVKRAKKTAKKSKRK